MPRTTIDIDASVLRELKKLKDSMTRLDELRSKAITFETQIEFIEKEIGRASCRERV